jgi:hypothetical protein
MYPDEGKASAVQFLQNTVGYFRSLGVHPKRILTDNGPAFRSKPFAQACRSLGLKHSFTKPYRPQTNGKAERFIQSALREWASFVGTFVGKINGNDTTAAFVVRVKHEQLVYENQGVTHVTEGDWALILNQSTAIVGTVAPGGTLTFRKNNTFAVDLTLPITGNGTAYFDGTLNHNIFPPPVTGRVFTKK